MGSRRLLGICFVLLLATACGERKAKEPEMEDVPLDAPPVSSSELDALSQVAGSDRLKNMKVSKRSTAPDGKSGMISFAPEEGYEHTTWSPQFTVKALQVLAQLVEDENIVLVYFFSSATEVDLSESERRGRPFDEAARELAEGEHEIRIVLFDLAKKTGTDENLLLEWGVSRAHVYKLFINGKASNYAGPTMDKAALVGYMTERAGPATTKVDSSEALDALIAAARSTVVIGVFGPSYQGMSSREAFTTRARDLREAGVLSFVEVSTRVGNGAKVFVTESGEPRFDNSHSQYAVVHPSLYVGKGESPFSLSADFRKMHSFVGEHLFPSVARMSERYVDHVRTQRKRPYLAVLLLDTQRHASKMRYIVKKVHKRLEAEPWLRVSFGFAIGTRAPTGSGKGIDPWVQQRFERTTIGGKFYSDDTFASEYVSDFTLVVADLSADAIMEPLEDAVPEGPMERATTRNWASNALAGSVPERVDALKWASFLKSIAAGELEPLSQGDRAAKEAGLTEMKMGFGEEAGEKRRKKTKRRKGKKGRAKAAVKDEV
jgi:hypothetical protein